MNARTVILTAVSITALIYASLGFSAPYEEGMISFKERKFAEAKRLWSIGASQGDINSQVQLGIMLMAGKHVSQDLNLSKELLLSASSKGSDDAKIALALIYFQKDSEDSNKGNELLESAALNGSNHAQSLIKVGESIDLRILGFGPVATEQELLIPVKFGSDFSPNSQSTAVGKAVIKKTCVACHSTGVAGAPKIGDFNEWRKRVRVGINKLAERSAMGYKACPPRGGDYMFTDEEIRAAVYYMAMQK